MLGPIKATAFGRDIDLEEPRSIRFGLTPVFLSNDLDLLDDLKLYLRSATGCDVALITQRTYQEVTALLVSGDLDAAWICGYPYQRFRDELELIAMPVWRGGSLYQSYLIVDAKRNAASLSDCRNDIHAFSDPDSNSGYLVTRSYVSDLNESLSTFFKTTFFTYSHRNVIRAVASGLAMSGSVDGYVFEVMTRLEPVLVSRTKVIVKSPWYGFPPIAAPADPSKRAIQLALRNAFLDMPSSALGKRILERLGLDGFALPQSSLYDGIALTMKRVRSAG
jgi:phosphonate transport system substrate-binding protein